LEKSDMLTRAILLFAFENSMKEAGMYVS
jgi:hypothetical protein